MALNPRQVDGLILWLRASAILGLSDSDAVAQWVDSSGNGNHAAQGTGANQPTYRTNVLNGKPVVRGDGIDDFLSFALPADTSRTIFVVAKQVAATNGRAVFSGGTHAFLTSFGGSWSYDSNSVGAGGGGGGVSTNWTAVVLKVMSASSMATYINGGAPSYFDPFDTITTSTAFTLLANAAGLNPWNGDIAEIIAYDSALSDPDRQRVEQYIYNEYGIGVDYGIVDQVYIPAVRLSERTTHAATVQMRDGRWERLGSDEVDLSDRAISFEFDTAIPGGFGPGEIVLPRPADFDPLDIRLLALTRIYEAETNRTLHEGRISGISELGPSQIRLELEGMAKHLEDDNTARLIGIDRDLSAWSGPSVQRRLNQIAAGQAVFDPSVQPDPTTFQSALALEFQGAWVAGGLPLAEAWYDADGLSLGALDYAWKKNANVNAADANFSWTGRLSSDDLLASSDSTGELRAVGPGSGTLVATASDRKFARVVLAYLAANGIAGATYSLFLTLLGVIGDHGLPLQGSVAAPNIGRGLLVSDLVDYIVGSWAPLVTRTLGKEGSIEPTAFAVPHCVFKEDTNAAAMVESLAVFGGVALRPLDWGVYDWFGPRTFFMRSPGTYGRTWRVRRDQAAEPLDAGPDAQKLINGIKVVYDDGTGKKLSVGPPGSFSTLETSDMQDMDADNPANQDGARHWPVYDAGITSQDGALLIGRMKLNDAKTQDWRGTISIKDTALDEAGNEFPAGLVRAGDHAVVEDDNNPQPRRIVETSYDSSSRSVNASCGAPPDYLDALMARAGVVLVGHL